MWHYLVALYQNTSKSGPGLELGLTWPSCLITHNVLFPVKDRRHHLNQIQVVGCKKYPHYMFGKELTCPN